MLMQRPVLNYEYEIKEYLEFYALVETCWKKSVKEKAALLLCNSNPSIYSSTLST